MKLQLLIILVATTLAYSNIFANGLVIDDRYFIEEWELTRSWSNVGKLLAGANPESQPGVYRPIRSLLYLVYYQLWGTNPIGYHAHSLVVHLAATVLVYLIISRISLIRPIGPMAPLVAALLFGLHPVHTESITYIAASMEMTGVVLMLAAFWLYLTAHPRGERSLHLGGVLLATLAYFTYEMTLTLPLLLLVYELLHPRGERNTHLRGEIFKHLGGVIPYALAAGVFLAVRLGLGVGLARGDYLAYSFYHTQLTMTKMWLKYMWLLIWPVTLSHNHTVLPKFEAFMTPYSDLQAILRQSILDPEILLAITIIIFIIFITIIARKKQPLVSFAIGWWFVSLLPVAYVFPQGTAIAEKYLYLASVGWVMLLAQGVYNIYNNYKHYKNYIWVALVALLLFYGGRTYARNRDWRSPRTLWEYEARIHPQSELAYYNLGIIYAQDGEKDKAMAAYQKALQLEPRFWQAENNLKNL